MNLQTDARRSTISETETRQLENDASQLFHGLVLGELSSNPFAIPGASRLRDAGDKTQFDLELAPQFGIPAVLSYRVQLQELNHDEPLSLVRQWCLTVCSEKNDQLRELCYRMRADLDSSREFTGLVQIHLDHSEFRATARTIESGVSGLLGLAAGAHASLNGADERAVPWPKSLLGQGVPLPNDQAKFRHPAAVETFEFLTTQMREVLPRRSVLVGSLSPDLDPLSPLRIDVVRPGVFSALTRGATLETSLDLWIHGEGADRKYLVKHPFKSYPIAMEFRSAEAAGSFIGGFIVGTQHGRDAIKHRDP